MVGSGSIQNTQNISTTPTNVQPQCSLPTEKAYGTPVVGNVTQMNSVQNVNAVSTMSNPHCQLRLFMVHLLLEM